MFHIQYLLHITMDDSSECKLKVYSLAYKSCGSSPISGNKAYVPKCSALFLAQPH